MRAIVTCTMAWFLLSFPSRVNADETADEAKKLEGTWLLESATLGGKKCEGKWPTLVFADGKLTFPLVDDEKKGKTFTVGYRVDLTHKPKVLHATLTEDGKKQEVEFAVYALDRDTLTIRHVDFTKLLPDDLSDGGAVVMVFKRKKGK